MNNQISFEETCTGPLFKNENGKRIGIAAMDVLFHGMLHEVQKCDLSIIHDDVDIKEVYSVRRSLRRGVTSEARNPRLPADDINANN